MHSCFTTSFRKRQAIPARGWIVRSVIMSLSIFLILAGCRRAPRPSVVPPALSPVPNPIPISMNPVGQNVPYRAALIRSHLSAYLDFVGSQVLPVMSDNIDQIMKDLHGLTDLRPGFFYHGHIDYPISVPGRIEALMDMNNVILQYHTLENPLIYIPSWREELRQTGDPSIQRWLERVRAYQQAISTPGAPSAFEFSPLTESEARTIASRWDTYRRQNGLSSPGPEMLTRLVYLVDGGMQSHYQEAFSEINRFHSIAFRPDGYVQLDNRTHLENTFSPLEITFESMDKCQTLLPLFEQARMLGFGYILNVDNIYVAQHPELLHDLDRVRLSTSLMMAIHNLPDDNLINFNHPSVSQPIAFFAAGNYIFIVDGSLDAPSIFK